MTRGLGNHVSHIFRVVIAVLLLSLLLFAATHLLAGEEQQITKKESTVELDTARPSPSGPEGGYGVHASACFVSETMIATPGGPVPISALSEGDEIYSYDSGERIIARVADLVIHDGEENPVNDFERFPLLEMSFDDGSSVKVTANHPLFSATANDWLAAELFNIGDEVTSDGMTKRVTNVVRSTERPVVYNIETDHISQTYYAGGILAHSGIDSLPGIASHVMVSTPNGVIPVSDLSVGDDIYSRADSGTVIITQVARIQSEQKPTEHSDWYELTLEDGNTLTVTGYEKVYVESTDAYVHAKDVKVGDSVTTQEGLETVTKITASDHGGLTYNLLTNDETHNFFANGILVHNFYSQASYYKQSSYYSQSSYSPPPEPDLIGENLSVLSGTLEVNQTITFEASVRNGGTQGVTSEPFVNAFAYRYNATGTWTVFSNHNYTDLAVGESATDTSSGISFSSAGNVEVGYCVDDGEVIDEITGTNNCVGIEITITDPGAPVVTDCVGVPNPAIVDFDVVTWTATVSGGVAPLTYQWTGDEGLGSTTNVNNIDHGPYTTSGTKNATVIVTDDLSRSSAPYSCGIGGGGGGIDANDPPTPTADLDIRELGVGSWQDSVNVDSGVDVELQWTSSGADRCVGDSYFSTGGGEPTSGIQQTVSEPASGNRTYTVTCHDDTYSTQIQATAVVNINPPPGNPDLDLDGPGRVRTGETTTIDWDTGGHANCVITGTNSQVVVPGTQTGTFTTDPITEETTYTISCDTGAPDSVVVRVLPIFEEI